MAIKFESKLAIIRLVLRAVSEMPASSIALPWKPPARCRDLRVYPSGIWQIPLGSTLLLLTNFSYTNFTVCYSNALDRLRVHLNIIFFRKASSWFDFTGDCQQTRVELCACTSDRERSTRAGEACTSDRQRVNANPDSDSCLCQRSLAGWLANPTKDDAWNQCWLPWPVIT